MDGDAEPTDTPLTANSTNIISCFVVVRESVLLAAQGVSVGWWKALTFISYAWAHDHTDSPLQIPFPQPFSSGEGWLIHDVSR